METEKESNDGTIFPSCSQPVSLSSVENFGSNLFCLLCSSRIVEQFNSDQEGTAWSKLEDVSSFESIAPNSSQLFHVVFILEYVFQVPRAALERRLLDLILQDTIKQEMPITTATNTNNTNCWSVKLLCHHCEKLVQSVVNIHLEIMDTSKKLRQIKQEIQEGALRKQDLAKSTEGKVVEKNDSGTNHDDDFVDYGNDCGKNTATTVRNCRKSFTIKTKKKVESIRTLPDKVPHVKLKGKMIIVIAEEDDVGPDDKEFQILISNEEDHRDKPLMTVSKNHRERKRPRKVPERYQHKPERETREEMIESPPQKEDEGSDEDFQPSDNSASSEDNDDDDDDEEAVVLSSGNDNVSSTPAKKARGRPRKFPRENPKPKGKIGRPRKNREQETKINKFRRLKCPVCNKFGFPSTKGDVLYEHLQTCLDSSSPSITDALLYEENKVENNQGHIATSSLLLCSICKIFQLPSNIDENRIKFAEHIGYCNGEVRVNTGMMVPLGARLFTCNICSDKKYMKLEEFLKHFTYHKRYVYKCNHSSGCTKKTFSVDNMNSHWRIRHQDDFKTIPFSSRFSEDHKLPMVPWFCFFCDQTNCQRQVFPSEEERDKHFETEHARDNKISRLYNCDLCAKCYSDSKELQLHTNTEHTMQLNQFKCDLCEENFSKEKHLQNHRAEKHRIGLVVCHICAYACVNTRRLENHIVETHRPPGFEKPFKCDECTASFARKINLRNHKMQKHYVPDAKIANPHQCPHCKKIFNHTGNLRLHVETIHEKKFRWSCHLCGKGCPTQPNLKIHLATVHGEGNYGRRKCPEEGCGLELPSRFKLKIHLAKHHKKEPIFPCEKCGRGFYRKEHYRNHMLIHTHPNVKPFQCQMCPEKRFRTKEHLMLHWRTHPEDEKIYLKSVGIVYNKTSSE